MNALNIAIKNALEASGNLKEANKAYLEFIKANFMIPVEKNIIENPPEVLFLHEQDTIFLPVFTELTYFNSWACDISGDIEILKLSGVDLLKGIGDGVTVCLNIGSDVYKEFNPAELARMRSMVLKFFNKNTNQAT